MRKANEKLPLTVFYAVHFNKVTSLDKSRDTSNDCIVRSGNLHGLTAGMELIINYKIKILNNKRYKHVKSN